MAKHLSLTKLNRKIHHWASIAVAIPLAVVLVTGVLLLLKKEFAWIQPSIVKGEQKGVSLEFDRILAVARTMPEAGIESWTDIDRLDVRPDKGMLKVRAKNNWEIQIDANTGKVLQVAYRRSDLIESIHDGSFFGDYAKLWVFLPAALIVIGLWITGIVLFFQLHKVKRKKWLAVPSRVLEAKARARWRGRLRRNSTSTSRPWWSARPCNFPT
jgi:uncharacterized iron-regulated membrane protein